MNTRILPVEVGGRRQLFLEDDFLVARADGVRYVLHQPVKHFDASFPGNDQSPNYPGCVLYDAEEKVYKRWYGHRPSNATAYAVSRDGHRWESPQLGIFEHEGSRRNNLLTNACSGFDIAVLKTPWDPDPAHRYKAAWSAWMLKPVDGGHVLDIERTGLVTAFSADGLRWTARGVTAPGHFDSHNSVFWDDRLGRYVAYVRAVVDDEASWHRLYGFQVPVMAEKPMDPVIAWKFDIRRRRAVARLESDDFVHWVNPQLVLLPGADDPPDSDLQTPGAFTHRAPAHAYFMTTCLFDWRRDQQWAQLAFSRDGVHWKRAGQGAPFIPLGPPGAFDAELVFATMPPYIVGERIVFCYTGSSDGHDRSAFSEGIHVADPGAPKRKPRPWRIGHASLPLDRFVALEAGSKGRQLTFEAEGVVTTHPLLFEGNELRVNVDARDGDLRVEILDVEGRVIPGFSLADCDRIGVDSLAHPVTWRGRATLDQARGRIVQLRLHLTFARLYAFQFR